MQNLNPIGPCCVINTVVQSGHKTPVATLLAQADAFKKEGDQQAFQLQELSDRVLFRHEVQRLYQTLTDTIHSLSAQGLPYAQIHERMRTVLDVSRVKLASSLSAFQEKAARFDAASSQFNPTAARALRAASSNSHDFVAPQVTLSERMKQRKITVATGVPILKDLGSITVGMPNLESSKAASDRLEERTVAARDKQSSQEESSNRKIMDENLKKIAKSAASDLLSKTNPNVKPIVSSFKKIDKFWSAFDISESDNKFRDFIISNVANFIIADMASTYVPSLPAYLTVCGAHIVSAASKEALTCLNHLHDEPEFRSLRDFHYQISGEGISFASSIQQAKLLARGLQIPSDRILAVHKRVVYILKSLANACGITDEAGKRWLIRFGESSSVYQEEQLWLRAHLAVMREKSKISGQ